MKQKEVMVSQTGGYKSAWWKRWYFMILNIYPPYLGAGIRLNRIAKDFKTIEVSMKLRFYNRNYNGTHFGGSLYSMCDPFFMLLLIENLGPDYVIWDKAAKIRFRRPGVGRVSVKFEITEEEVDRIRREADTKEKVEPVFNTVIVDEQGTTVAELEKLVYVRRK